jgi:prevent-host-death family protein
MKTITAREANQAFSKILAEVTGGQEIVITKHGTPVARIMPYSPRQMTPERKAAADHLIALLEKGLPLGGPPYPKRDEIYDRGAGSWAASRPKKRRKAKA